MDNTAAFRPAGSAGQLLEQLRARLLSHGFDGLRTHAAAELADLLPTVQLVIRPLSLPVDNLERGYLELPDYGACYVEHYTGPPEPLQLIAAALPATERERALLELFMQQLLTALQGTGYRQELRWLARRDWLTGLPGQQALERAIGAEGNQPLLLALLELATRPEVGPDRTALLRRRFGRALRNELLEGEQAFWLESGRFALLVKDGQRQRYLDFLHWHAAEAQQAWVGLAEAPGAEVLKLADARLRGQAAPAFRPSGTAAEPAERMHWLRLLAGSDIILKLSRAQLSNLRFRRPLSLIMDIPVGYALEALPTVEGSALVVTSSRSRGYLLDLLALNPQGLVIEPDSLASLRAQLQRVADGEQVYAGPLLKDELLPRERHVWRLSAQGLDNSAIARKLGVSAKTVANYLSALQQKLDLGSHTELVLAYWTDGAS